MARKLSESRIERTSSQGGRRTVLREPTVPGLELRVTGSGNKSWSLRYRTTDGERVRVTLGSWPDLPGDDAREQARELVKAGTPLSSRITLSELTDQYVARWAKPRKRSWRDDERLLTIHALPYLGPDTPARDVRKRDLVAFLDHLVQEKGLGPGANRAWAVLRRCMRWAVEVDLLDADPTSGVRSPVREQPRDKMPSDGHVIQLWHNLTNHSMTMQLVVRVLLLTGLRVGEVCSARWEDINDTELFIPASRAKGRRPHRVPMTPPLATVLMDAQAELVADQQWIFSTPRYASGGHVRSRSVLQAVRRHVPTYQGYTLHDIRRLVGSRMAEAGAPLEVIQSALGHAPVGVTQIHYLHEASLQSRVREALAQWQAQLLRLVG